MIRFDPPGGVRWIARTLEESGYETWAVGGAVRDALAGRPSKDWDLTTRATPAEMRRIFPRTIPIGVDHGTMGILDRSGTLFEVTTFRRDVETTGRHATVVFAESLDEDLARRDFTINAVAWHPLRARLHDPFEGARDMESRILRTVGVPADRFAEDYLRVLRALRFAGVFRLEVEGETWRALVAAVPELGILSPERVRDEMEKVLGAAAPPSAALSLYAASGALRALYPELAALIGLRNDRGPVGAWSRTLRTVDLISRSHCAIRWAALLNEVGLPVPGGQVGERGGSRATLRAITLLERLRSSNARIREVAEIVAGMSDPPRDDAADAELRRWVARTGRGAVPGCLRIWGALARGEALTGGGGTVSQALRRARRIRAILKSGAPLEVGDVALNGRDLIRIGYRPGPYFGEVLDFLLGRVLDEPELNERDRLLPLAEHWLEERGFHPGGRGSRGSGRESGDSIDGAEDGQSSGAEDGQSSGAEDGQSSGAEGARDSGPEGARGSGDERGPDPEADEEPR